MVLEEQRIRVFLPLFGRSESDRLGQMELGGFVFAHDDNDTYFAIVLRKNSGTDTIELVEYTSGSGWGSTIDSATATITEDTEYTIPADRPVGLCPSVCDRIKQRMVEAHVVGQSSATFIKDRTNFFGTGKIGVVSDKTSVTFDDFTYSRSTPYEPGLPGWYTLGTARPTLAWIRATTN